MSNKRNYWLKLKEDFFQEDVISWIEEQEKGVYYTNFYLKLCLKAINSQGILIRRVGDMLIPYDTKALSKMTGVDVDTIIVAMEIFKKTGLVEILENGEIYLTKIMEMVGSETDKAKIMREKRAKEKLGLPQPEKTKEKPAKSNAERQRAYRAKQYCEKKGNIKLIDNATNNKDFNGNYYLTLKRDECKCVMCSNEKTLQVYNVSNESNVTGNENSNGNNVTSNVTSNENNYVTLCNDCYEKTLKINNIPKEIFEKLSISNTSTDKRNVTEQCYQETEQCYTDIDIDTDIDTDIDIISMYTNERNTNDENLAFMSKIYQSNIGVANGIVGEYLIEISEKIDKDLFKRAVEICTERGCCNLGYLKGIIKKWLDANITTLEQLKAFELQNNKSNNSIPQNKKTIPNYKTGVRVHETFRDYTPDELEKLLLESQKGKF